MLIPFRSDPKTYVTVNCKMKLFTLIESQEESRKVKIQSNINSSQHLWLWSCDDSDTGPQNIGSDRLSNTLSNPYKIDSVFTLTYLLIKIVKYNKLPGLFDLLNGIFLS